MQLLVLIAALCGWLWTWTVRAPAVSRVSSRQKHWRKFKLQTVRARVHIADQDHTLLDNRSTLLLNGTTAPLNTVSPASLSVSSLIGHNSQSSNRPALSLSLSLSLSLGVLHPRHTQPRPLQERHCYCIRLYHG